MLDTLSNKTKNPTESDITECSCWTLFQPWRRVGQQTQEKELNLNGHGQMPDTHPTWMPRVPSLEFDPKTPQTLRGARGRELTHERHSAPAQSATSPRSKTSIQFTVHTSTRSKNSRNKEKTQMQFGRQSAHGVPVSERPGPPSRRGPCASHVAKVRKTTELHARPLLVTKKTKHLLTLVPMTQHAAQSRPAPDRFLLPLGVRS